MLNSPNSASSCGMYPTLAPGTPVDLDPGGAPNTSTDPDSTRSLPTMHFRRVVLPQPEGPRLKNE